MLSKNKKGVLLFIFVTKISILTTEIFSYLSRIKNISPSHVNLKDVLFKIDKLLKKNSLSKKEYETKLNNILTNIRSFTSKKVHPKTIFSRISEYLTQYESFSPVDSEDSWEINLFTSFLKNKQGTCLPFSLLYLIISQHLKLPVYGSLSPEHIFVRYSTDNADFNIETVYFELDNLIYEPATFISSS